MEEASTIIFRLFLSALLGALIGLEREMHARAAGLRTHILVATGSTLIMMVSHYMFTLYQFQSATTVVRLDPGRIAAMTITGIGFLGAGTIIQSKEIIRGLTTAACLWIIAAVGLAVGCGFYLPALIATFIALTSLYLLKYFERFLKKDWYRKLTVTIDDNTDPFSFIEEVFSTHRINIIKVGCEVGQSIDDSHILGRTIAFIAVLDIVDDIAVWPGVSVTVPLPDAKLGCGNVPHVD